MFNDMLQKLITHYLQHAITAGCAYWITWAINNHVASQNDMNTFIQVLVAILIAIGNALYNQARDKIKKQTQVTVPTHTVEAVKATVAANSPAVQQ